MTNNMGMTRYMEADSLPLVNDILNPQRNDSMIYKDYR